MVIYQTTKFSVYRFKISKRCLKPRCARGYIFSKVLPTIKPLKMNQAFFTLRQKLIYNYTRISDKYKNVHALEIVLTIYNLNTTWVEQWACIPFQYEQAPCVCLGPLVFPQETSYQHETHTLYPDENWRKLSMNNRTTPCYIKKEKNRTCFPKKKRAFRFWMMKYGSNHQPVYPHRLRIYFNIGDTLQL